MLWISIFIGLMLLNFPVQNHIYAQREALGVFTTAVIGLAALLPLAGVALYGLVLRPVLLIYRAIRTRDSWVSALGDYGLPLGFFLCFILPHFLPKAPNGTDYIGFEEAWVVLVIMLILKGIYEWGKRGALRYQRESRKFWNNLFQAMHERRLPFPELDKRGKRTPSNAVICRRR